MKQQLTPKLTEEQLRKVILAFFPDADLHVKDLTGTGDHWHVDIASQKFNGKNLIDQHKLVYDALADYMKNDIHALSLDTRAIAPTAATTSK